jgi:hypothetical protein
LRGAVETFQTHEHVGHRRAQAGDVNGAADQSVGAPKGPVNYVALLTASHALKLTTFE